MTTTNKLASVVNRWNDPGTSNTIPRAGSVLRRSTGIVSDVVEGGSFVQELKRTKPYGYSLFNLDGMAMICQILTDKTQNLWTFQTPDGRSIRRGIAYLHPCIADKNAWPFAHDVLYWADWPVAQPSLVLGAVQFENRTWLATWQRLNHDPQVPEVVRNLPVRNPLIWLP